MGKAVSSVIEAPLKLLGGLNPLAAPVPAPALAPPPPPVERDDAAVLQTQEEEQQRRARRGGRVATIATSPLGVPGDEDVSVRPTLIGG